MSQRLAERLSDCWSRSDQIFGLLEESALSERPIALRHPLIFYLGHLPAFAWNQVCRGVLGMPSFRADFDSLFERGIDPMGVDKYEASVEWPPVKEVLEYRDRVRAELIDAIEPLAACAGSNPMADHGRIYDVAIEHELMHQETLQYILQHLSFDLKQRPAGMPAYRFDGAVDQGAVAVGGGPVVLGADFEPGAFGWDNEFPEHAVEVGDFVVDRTPVRNAEYLEFVMKGGYGRPEFWRDEDWRWRERTGLEHPVFWVRADDGFLYRTLFDDLELERAGDWPVFVSHAEAEAFCRWRGGRLATEAEIHRAAYSTPEGGVRSFPWGEEDPADRHGNFDFRHWAPTPVGCFPEGDSAWGVSELVGNGWEWTASVFAPFPGFEANIPSYPGYSADFFDGLHHVLLGASWATPTGLIRRSFRNWFQRHYPFMFATFRCVR